MGVKFWLKRYFQLLGLSGRMDLAMLLRDTKIAMMYIVTDTIINLSSLAGVFMLAWRFDGIGDMGRYEVLFMLSYISVVMGVFAIFFAGNNVHISRRIGRGQLEHMFIQPVPLPLQLLTDGFFPFTGCGVLLTGIAAMVISLNALQIIAPWWWVLSLIGSIIVTLAIIIAQSYLYSSLAFYAPAAAEEISMYVIDLSSELSHYPLGGMPKAVQTPLLWIFPAGLIGWFPSMALLGKPPLGLPAFFPVLVAAIFFFLARYAFTKGLKHYVQSGSNRYLPFGFRR